MLKPLTLSMFIAMGCGLIASLGLLMCGHREPAYDIRPEPVEIRPERVERREPVIRADDRPRIYSPLEDM